jgi:hypothetical protein
MLTMRFLGVGVPADGIPVEPPLPPQGSPFARDPIESPVLITSKTYISAQLWRNGKKHKCLFRVATIEWPCRVVVLALAFRRIQHTQCRDHSVHIVPRKSTLCIVYILKNEVSVSTNALGRLSAVLILLIIIVLVLGSFFLLIIVYLILCC